MTRYQRAYVRKVIDTVGGLDNVLYEIANESHNESIEWQRRMTTYVRQYEETCSRQHPVGMTVTFGYPKKYGLNGLLLRSPADWISPNADGPRGFSYRDNPPPADGAKVVVSDTDHFFGNKGKDYSWAWKSFCRGHNLLYMDMWSVEPDDADRQRVRRTLGDVRRFANRMNLLATTPRRDLSSTKFCLAAAGREYLIYAPFGGPIAVDLTDVDSESSLFVEWFNPRIGASVKETQIRGGANRTLKPPWSGDVVLYLQNDSNTPDKQ